MNVELSEVQWVFADGEGREDRRLVPRMPINVQVAATVLGLHVEALPVRYRKGQQRGVCVVSDNQLQQALGIDELAGAYATVTIPKANRPEGSWRREYVILITPHSR
jgi:hypothetical protein